MLSLAVLPTAIVITYQQSIRNLKIMRLRIRTILCCTAIFSAVSFFTITFAETNPLSKAQVAERIAKVENGVDDFEKYLTSRGENAKDQAGSAKSSGAAKRGRVQTPRTRMRGKIKPGNQKTTSRTPWTI